MIARALTPQPLQRSPRFVFPDRIQSLPALWSSRVHVTFRHRVWFVPAQARSCGIVSNTIKRIYNTINKTAQTIVKAEFFAIQGLWCVEGRLAAFLRGQGWDQRKSRLVPGWMGVLMAGTQKRVAIRCVTPWSTWSLPLTPSRDTVLIKRLCRS